jgi:hypothetical protein
VEDGFDESVRAKAARSVTPDAGPGGIVEGWVAAEWESMRAAATEERVL